MLNETVTNPWFWFSVFLAAVALVEAYFGSVWRGLAKQWEENWQQADANTQKAMEIIDFYLAEKEKADGSNASVDGSPSAGAAAEEGVEPHRSSSTLGLQGE